MAPSLLTRKVKVVGWRDDSVVQSSGCSCRGSGFSPSMVAYNYLEHHFRGSDGLFWPQRESGTQLVLRHTCKQNPVTPIKINKKFKKES